MVTRIWGLLCHDIFLHTEKSRRGPELQSKGIFATKRPTEVENLPKEKGWNSAAWVTWDSTRKPPAQAGCSWVNGMLSLKCLLLFLSTAVWSICLSPKHRGGRNLFCIEIHLEEHTVVKWRHYGVTHRQENSDTSLLLPTMTLIPFMREQMFLEEAESPGMWEAEEITHAGTHWYGTPAHAVTHPVLQKPQEGLQKGQNKPVSSESTTLASISSVAQLQPQVHTRSIHPEARLQQAALKYQPATAKMDRNRSSRILLPVGNWKATVKSLWGKPKVTEGKTGALRCFLWVQQPSAWSHTFHQLRPVPLETPAAGFSSSQRSGQISR